MSLPTLMVSTQIFCPFSKPCSSTQLTSCLLTVFQVAPCILRDISCSLDLPRSARQLAEDLETGGLGEVKSQLFVTELMGLFDQGTAQDQLGRYPANPLSRSDFVTKIV